MNSFEMINTKADVDVDTRRRLTWGRPSEFLFALIGYNVGLGMLWRFPYLCYRNGGGAFLIPYFLSCIFIVIPMYTFEIGLGHFTKLGRVAAWDRIPLMRGIGLGSILIAVYSTIPYKLIMGWCIFYFVSSLTTGDLPWTTCDNPWNTKSCVQLFPSSSTTFNMSALNNFSHYDHLNTTNGGQQNSLSQFEFWRYKVLQVNSGIGDFSGGYNLTMSLYMFIAISSVYIMTVKGVKTSGKVVYFTATFPYVMLLILLVRGLTLDGAWEGIKVFLFPDMERLKDPSLWVEGMTQALYSYGVGYLGLTAFGSYNRPKQDYLKHALFVVGGGVITALVMGVMTFSITGFLAHVNNADVSDVVQSGPGLVFQVIPTALALMPLPQLWSVLFFLMLFFVAIDSMFADFEGLSTVLGDAFPSCIANSKRRALTNFSLAVGYFILGQIQLTGSGIYWFELFNYYGATGLSLLVLVTSESLTVGWLWNAEQYRDDVKTMVGRSLPKVFDYCFKFIIPLFAFSAFFFFCIEWKPLTISGYIYPAWANVIGWMMSLSSMLCVPGVMIYVMCQGKGNLRKRWSNAITSRKDFAAVFRNNEYGDDVDNKDSLV